MIDLLRDFLAVVLALAGGTFLILWPAGKLRGAWGNP